MEWKVLQRRQKAVERTEESREDGGLWRGQRAIEEIETGKEGRGGGTKVLDGTDGCIGD
jgi:hypothetical protein